MCIRDRINGDLVPTAGVLDIGETVRIGYFSQQIKDMDESKRVICLLYTSRCV